jgi:hypothetical protein
MTFRRRTSSLVALALAIVLAGCGSGSEDPVLQEPAIVEPIDGSELTRIILTDHAAQRLGIATTTVAARGGSVAVPYAAVLYDSEGHTWAYTAPEDNVFQRHEIVVDRVEDGIAILTDGPPAGTQVVTTGAAELYGTETGVGGGGH